MYFYNLFWQNVFLIYTFVVLNLNLSVYENKKNNSSYKYTYIDTCNICF